MIRYLRYLARRIRIALFGLNAKEREDLRRHNLLVDRMVACMFAVREVDQVLNTLILMDEMAVPWEKTKPREYEELLDLRAKARDFLHAPVRGAWGAVVNHGALDISEMVEELNLHT